MRFERIAATCVLALLLPACQKAEGTSDRPAVSSGSPKDVMAEMDGSQVTREELDARVADRLAALRQQEYEIRRQALEELVRERLVAKEASARGLTPEKLLKEEVDGKAAGPSREEIDSFYEQNKARIVGRTKEQVVPEIERTLRQRRLAERRVAYHTELLTRARVRFRLEPPRIQVAIPATAPALGPADAPVTIVEFADYQCSYCRRAEPTLAQVLDQYPGKIRLVHRDFPLEGHPRALPASRAANCAAEQGRFWEYHRGIFTKGGDLSDGDLQKRAADLGLNPATFSECLASQRHDTAIRASFEDGQKLGVSGTPTFFINGRILVGARPFEAFQAVIDEELSGGRR